MKPAHVFTRLALLLTSALLLTACAGGTAPDALPLLRLGADLSAAPLAEGLANAYEGQGRDLRVTLYRGHRQAVLEALSRGEIDAALLLHPPEGDDLFFTPIAYETLAAITGPGNPVNAITADDLRAMLAGDLIDWAAAGGSAAPVTVVVRERGSSTREAAGQLLMEGRPITSTAQIAADEEHLLTLISGMPGGIAITTAGLADSRVKVLNLLRDRDATADDAPLTLRTSVGLATAAEPEGAVRRFLDWVLGAEGQRVVSRYMQGVRG
ncbi:MAG: phosphate ABC transporter substrate-binding protein [Anaerolineae bacterium]